MSHTDSCKTIPNRSPDRESAPSDTRAMLRELKVVKERYQAARLAPALGEPR